MTDKKYRVQIFKTDNTSENAYFYNRDEAIIYGAKQLHKPDVKCVFLLREIIDDKYEVEVEIK